MAIKTVKATINGQTYDLTLNSASGKWEATITAPGQTSYNLAGGYYNVSVEATNEAGTKGSADASTVNGLKLVVKETVAPVITIVSPTSGAYVANSKQPVVFNIVDESGGSGVDISTLVVKQDGTAVAAANITHTAIANGYSVTYTPSAALSDGSHTELLPTPEQAALLAEGRQVITGVASPASSAPARNGAPRLSF